MGGSASQPAAKYAGVGEEEDGETRADVAGEGQEGSKGGIATDGFRWLLRAFRSVWQLDHCHSHHSLLTCANLFLLAFLLFSFFP